MALIDLNKLMPRVIGYVLQDDYNKSEVATLISLVNGF